MAEQILMPQQGHGTRRCRKLSTKVDLTPMVDLGFLLITFFILTSNWKKARDIEMLLPAGQTASTPYGESTVLTLIPLSGNHVFFYNGDLDYAEKNHSYGVIEDKGMHSLIMQKQRALDASKKYTRNDLSLIIKPTEQTEFQNIVRVLDEILINDLQHYSFVDISPSEKKWMSEKSVAN